MQKGIYVLGSDQNTIKDIASEAKNMKDTEKKNIAEVILAKHRAGSTGTVELLWLGNYTKFVNIDKNR